MSKSRAALLLSAVLLLAAAPALAAPSDTGRMSESEYRLFRDAVRDLNRETGELAEGVQKCAVIGQTGALADFADCMDDAYRGFRDSAEYAYYIADDLLDDTLKKCGATLRTYLRALDRFAAAAARLHRSGSLLRIADLAPASRSLAAKAKPYTKVAGRALRVCAPR